MNQDNPFATGVSINQDMVMEEWVNEDLVNVYLKDNPNDRLNTDKYCTQDFQDQLRKCFEEPPTYVISSRELLALGREEE